jgi:8-oxo-dGTP diphosphatase
MDGRKVVHVVGAVMVREGRCFAARRAAHKADAGAWELPGGKVEAGERPEEALARELQEELGVEVEVGAWVARGRGEGERVWVELDLYMARWVSGELRLSDHDEAGWFGVEELGGLGWTQADRVAMPQVVEALRGLGA